MSPTASAAPSGTLSYALIEGFWVAAGGPQSQASTAAAITGAESSYEPGIIQPGQPYSTTGWGLWQITPGNSVSTYGQDYQLLDPWNNAEAAVAKYKAAGNSFTPWTTYNNGAYRNFQLANAPSPAQECDPGEYIAINSGPSGTHNSSQAGATYGPAEPGCSTNQYVFWKGTDGSLWEKYFQNGTWSLASLGFGPLGSEPTAAVGNGGAAQYVFWKGTDNYLWEAYYSGGWHGVQPKDSAGHPFGPLGSAPSVGVDASGNQYVFWEGTDSRLWEAYYTGSWHGTEPTQNGASFGPMGSKPSVAVDSAGRQYVFWEGTDSRLWEAYYNAGWHGTEPKDSGGNVFGPMGSAPAAAMDGSGNAYVFWKGTDTSLWEAYFNPGGSWHGVEPTWGSGNPWGPLGSAPSAAANSGGNQYVVWQGTDNNLWQVTYAGGWTGQNLGSGPLGSQPSIAVTG